MQHFIKLSAVVHELTEAKLNDNAEKQYCDHICRHVNILTCQMHRLLFKHTRKYSNAADLMKVQGKAQV